MEEKQCPELGCGGRLEQEENANKWTQIFVCSKCGKRYRMEDNKKLQKTKGCVERIKCAAC